MQNNLLEILNRLKARKIKITKPRKMLLDILINSETPQNIESLYTILKNESDLSSLYRNLKLLSKLEIIRIIDFGDGKFLYELKPSKHKHYINCIKCGLIQGFDICVENQVSEKTNFHITSHTMEFKGYCPECYKSVIK